MSIQNPFVHLHCHSEYSLLEATIRVGNLVKRCKELEMPAVAITDNGSMYGALDFYLKAKSEGINPIIGCEMYLTDTIEEKVRSRQRLIVLAKSFSGYQNLIELVSISHVDGFYYRPRIDLKYLEKLKNDLIVISPGGYGPVASHLRDHNDQ